MLHGPPPFQPHQISSRSDIDKHHVWGFAWMVCAHFTGIGSGDSLLVKCRTRNRKVASSNPDRSGGWIFFSRFNFVCWLLFGVRPTRLLPRWHVKDPGHSVRSADDRLHLKAHTPLTQRSRCGLTCRCPDIVREPIRIQAHRHLVREHSATVVSARWATVNRSWRKEWNQCARADLHYKKKKRKKKKEKRHRQGMNDRTFSQSPRKRGESYHHSVG